jgi:hypothetical protein
MGNSGDRRNQTEALVVHIGNFSAQLLNTEIVELIMDNWYGQ